jgi:hypothetical protein
MHHTPITKDPSTPSQGPISRYPRSQHSSTSLPESLSYNAMTGRTSPHPTPTPNIQLHPRPLALSDSNFSSESTLTTLRCKSAPKPQRAKAQRRLSYAPTANDMCLVLGCEPVGSRVADSYLWDLRSQLQLRWWVQGSPRILFKAAFGRSLSSPRHFSFRNGCQRRR